MAVDAWCWRHSPYHHPTGFADNARVATMAGQAWLQQYVVCSLASLAASHGCAVLLEDAVEVLLKTCSPDEAFETLIVLEEEAKVPQGTSTGTGYMAAASLLACRQSSRSVLPHPNIAQAAGSRLGGGLLPTSFWHW
jgi:hypothetical protein